MDGLGRLLCVGNYIELAGHGALMRPVTLGMLAVCENHILSGRRTPMDIVQETALSGRLSEKDITKLATRAKDDIKRNRSWRVVSSEDMLSWIHGREGIAFTAWLCLRGRHPLATTPQHLADYFLDHDDEASRFVRRRDICSGFDLLSNLDWVNQEEMVPPGKKSISSNPGRPAWKKLIHDIAESVYWHPRDLARLTLPAMRALLSDPNDPTISGTATVSGVDARELMGMTPEQRKAYLLARRNNDGE